MEVRGTARIDYAYAASKYLRPARVSGHPQQSHEGVRAGRAPNTPGSSLLGGANTLEILGQGHVSERLAGCAAPFPWLNIYKV